MSNVRVNAHLQMTALAEFPATPKPGQIAFKDGILYVYATVNGLLTWYPMNRPQSSHVHTQGLASTVWTVYHPLATTDLVCTIYNDAGETEFAAIESLYDPAAAEGQQYKVIVSLTEAMTGRAVLFGVESLSAPRVQAEQVDAQSITVNSEPVTVESDLTSALDGMASTFEEQA